MPSPGAGTAPGSTDTERGPALEGQRLIPVAPRGDSRPWLSPRPGEGKGEHEPEFTSAADQCVTGCMSAPRLAFGEIATFGSSAIGSMPTNTPYSTLEVVICMPVF